MEPAEETPSIGGNFPHEHDLDAWKAVHAHLTIALLLSKDALQAEEMKRRYLMEEIYLNITPVGTLNPSSKWGTVSEVQKVVSTPRKRSSSVSKQPGSSRNKNISSDAISPDNEKKSMKDNSKPKSTNENKASSSTKVDKTKKTKNEKNKLKEKSGDPSNPKKKTSSNVKNNDKKSTKSKKDGKSSNKSDNPDSVISSHVAKVPPKKRMKIQQDQQRKPPPPAAYSSSSNSSDGSDDDDSGGGADGTPYPSNYAYSSQLNSNNTTVHSPNMPSSSENWKSYDFNTYSSPEDSTNIRSISSNRQSLGADQLLSHPINSFANNSSLNNTSMDNSFSGGASDSLFHAMLMQQEQQMRHHRSSYGTSATTASAGNIHHGNNGLVSSTNDVVAAAAVAAAALQLQGYDDHDNDDGDY